MTRRTTRSLRDAARMLLCGTVALGCSEVVTAPGADAAAGADAAVDVTGACNARHDVPVVATPSGVCDGIGRAYCERMGAQGGSGLTTYATCVPMAERCVLADHCDSTDVRDCHCGLGGACHEGEICAAGAPGATPHCTCLTPPAR